MTQRGVLITFEGPEGSGKSTQVKLLAEFLAGMGLSVVTTFEPGGTEIGKQIRDALHNRDNTKMDPVAEMLLFQADRAQHVGELIEPALLRGATVICDRFYDSTFAYQGGGRGLDDKNIKELTRMVTRGLVPDITVYLAINPETGINRRLEAVGAEWNRLDEMALEFHEQVRERYLEMIMQEPERFIYVDGRGRIREVAGKVRELVFARLVERGLVETENVGVERG